MKKLKEKSKDKTKPSGHTYQGKIFVISSSHVERVLKTTFFGSTRTESLVIQNQVIIARSRIPKK